MANKTKKDNKKAVSQPAVGPAQEFYQDDPNVKQDASGDWIFTAPPATTTQEGTTNNSVETRTTPSSGLSKLYDTATTAFSNAETARKAYDQAYTDLGDAYKAVADLMKPKDRTAERKRLRNAALAQAIGQGISAIFGAAYTGKKGGRVVMPEDFASKTLAKAEELREKGLIEEREFAKLMGDLRMSEADAKVKKLGNDYATAKADYDRAKAAIAEFEKMRHQQEFQQQQAKDNREFQQQQAKDNREFQANEAQKTRNHAITLENLKNSNTSKGVFVGQSDAMIALSSQFMPKTKYQQVSRTDARGERYTEWVEVPITSYDKENYEAALRGAQQLYASAKGLWGDAVAKKALEDGSLANIKSHLKAAGRDWQWITQQFAGRTPQEIISFFNSLSQTTNR